MKKFLFLYFIGLINVQGNAQILKLNRTIDIDTLYVWISYHSAIDATTHKSIDSGFINSISNYNQIEDAFYIVLDSVPSKYSLNMTMQPIKYVKPLGQVLNTAYNLALVPFHYFRIREEKIFIPLTPLFIQSRSVITYTSTDSLFLHKKKHNNFSLGGKGYLRNQQKQYSNLTKKSDKYFLKFFCKIAKEDKRKKKHDIVYSNNSKITHPTA
tara:strand:+ start:127 stop:762 length:636 start_codon:yes stop_codon:yes gene_type:complete